MEVKEFADKLDAYLAQKNITQDKLAELSGYAANHISRVKNGRSKLTPTFISRICTALNLPEDYFNPTNSLSDLYFPVPLREAGGGMGGGVLSGSKRIISYISLRKDFLLTKTSNLDALSFIHAQGDSMAPTIPDGAAVLIDESQVEPVNGKIFYVLLNDIYLIKRLEVLNGNVIALISDGWNKKYIISEQDSFQILGKAILQQTLL